MRRLVVSVLAALPLAGIIFGWQYLEEQSHSVVSVTAAPMTVADQPQAAISLAENKGCTACHSVDGSVGIGPSWKGSYGSTRTLTDGSMVQVDAMYLRESILQPAARVVAGYQNVMVAPVLSEQEVAQLVELIRQLGSGEW